MHVHPAMLTFDLGARVSFESNSGERLTGTLVKLNRKTVTVITDDQRQWRVSPSLLTPIGGVTPGTTFVLYDDNESSSE